MKILRAANISTPWLTTTSVAIDVVPLVIPVLVGVVKAAATTLLEGGRDLNFEEKGEANQRAQQQNSGMVKSVPNQYWYR